jgi:hypothetical protein
MADGRHCPQCGRDTGWWAVVCAASAFRIWCPRCFVPLEHRGSRKIQWADLAAQALIVGAAFWTAGLPALISRAFNSTFAVWDDEWLVQLVVFAALLFSSCVLKRLAWASILRRTGKLVCASTPQPKVSIRTKIRRILAGMPLSLRFFLASVLRSAVVGVLSTGWPVCRESMLIWRIERAGGTVSVGRDPIDLQRWWFGGDRSGKRQSVIFWVRLEGFDVTDSSLATVAGCLAHLDGTVSLIIKRTQISDGGLAHLQRVNNLEALYLDGINPKFAKFIGINPRELQFNDAAVEHILSVPNLRKLDLGYTHLSEAGIGRLEGRFRNLTSDGPIQRGERDRKTSRVSGRLQSGPVTE